MSGRREMGEKRDRSVRSEIREDSYRRVRSDRCEMSERSEMNKNNESSVRSEIRENINKKISSTSDSLSFIRSSGVDFECS